MPRNTLGPPEDSGRPTAHRLPPICPLPFNYLGQGCVGTADNQRRRGGGNPPPLPGTPPPAPDPDFIVGNNEVYNRKN